MNRWTAVLLAGTMAQGWAADPATLLERVQAKVRDSARNIPRYVCRQNIQRQAFLLLREHSRLCGVLPEPDPIDPAKAEVPAAPAKGPEGSTLVSVDRAHLDVMVAGGTELFSWPGGGRFETADPTELLGGGFGGNGDFEGFLTDAFTAPGATFQLVGACPGASCVRYRYDVPLASARYTLKTAHSQALVGYHGTLDLDPQTADLLTMTVIPTDTPQRVRGACDVRTRMTYTRATMNAADFTIPASAGKEFLATDGSYFSNQVSYTNCRQYTAESSLSFGTDAPEAGAAQPAAPPSLPRPGTKLELRLASPIDSDRSWAGDRLDATLVRAVRAADGHTIPAGTVVRGHLAAMERLYFPAWSVQVAIRFDTMVLNGAPVTLGLEPAGKQDARGRGVFQFNQRHLKLDRGFTSAWRVR